MEKGIIIAIDGPAGAGKSTIAKMLAKELQFQYVDTGAIYRTVAYKVEKEKISWNDCESITAICKNLNLEFAWNDGNQSVLLDGENVTDAIRTPEVSELASKLSALEGVRKALLPIQRNLAKHGSSVFEGRDIGTVVLPHAHIKFFLDASLEERSTRRKKELAQKNIPFSDEEISRGIFTRDERDKNRNTAPLRQSGDAIYIDSTHMGIEEVVEKMIENIKKL